MTETCRWIEQQSVVPNLPTAPPRTSQEKKLQQPNWAEIPTDALSVIFQKLGALNVLVSGQGVCRPWRQLALDPTQEFWRCIDMRRLKTTTSAPSKGEAERLARAAVDRSGGNIEELHVMSVSEGFLRYTANRATNMRCCGLIRVFPLSPEVLVDFVRCLPLLEELHIYKCLFSRETYGDIGRACPQLKCLWVDGKYDSDDDDVDSESEYDLMKRSSRTAMASKALLMLGVLIVAALFVTSDAGRELAEETKENTVKRATEAGVAEQKYGGGYNNGGGYPGGGGGYHNGGGYPGGGGGYPGGGGGYHNGGGYPGGGGGYPGGGGGYHNGGGGGRCYNGCCRRGYYGGCQCCAHPDEIPDPEYRAEPTYGHP